MQNIFVYSLHNKQLCGFDKQMPNIILKINAASDKIYRSDNICCYFVAAPLPAAMQNELAASGKMILAAPGVEMPADGLVAEVDSSKPVKVQLRPLREKLGTKKVLGAVINPTRHEAMLASEVEPEFVAFRLTAENLSKAADVIKWYNELFLIQSAADLSAGLQDIKGLDVDFVIINSRDYDDFSC